MAKANGVIYSSVESPQHPKLYSVHHGTSHYKQGPGRLSMLTLKFSNKGFWHLGVKLTSSVGSRGSSFKCQSTETQNTETTERVRHYDDCLNISRYTWILIKIINNAISWVVKHHCLTSNFILLNGMLTVTGAQIHIKIFYQLVEYLIIYQLCYDYNVDFRWISCGICSF